MNPFVQWFRQAGPYINAHRGKTFVVLFGGEAVEADNFSSLIHDLALLHSLGTRLVLVHGARPQADLTALVSMRPSGVAATLG